MSVVVVTHEGLKTLTRLDWLVQGAAFTWSGIPHILPQQEGFKTKVNLSVIECVPGTPPRLMLMSRDTMVENALAALSFRS